VKRAASLGVILGVAFLDLLGFGVLIPQLGVYGVRFGGSPFLIGLIASSYSVMQFLFAPVLGRLSDRYGRRPVLMISQAGAVAAYLLFASADSIVLFAVSRVVAGIMGANIATAQAYVADVTTEEDRTRGMGLLGAAFGMGFVIGPGVGGLLGYWGGNLAIGGVCAGLSALNLVLTFFLVPESLKPGSQSAVRPSVGGLFERLSLPGVGLVLLIGFIFTAGFAQVESTFSIYVLTRFLAPGVTATSTLFDLRAQASELVLRDASRKVGYLFVAIGVTGAIIQGGFMRQLKRGLGEKRMLFLGLVVTGLGVLLISGMPSYAAMFVPCAVLAVGTSLVNPSVTALVSMLAPQDRRGELLGGYQSMTALGRIVGPSLGGLLFTTLGATAPYLSAGAVIILVSALALRLPTASPGPGPAPGPAAPQ
jgi:DHA1 family tetracycline resistance protein-like MFS transporter